MPRSPLRPEEQDQIVRWVAAFYSTTHIVKLTKATFHKSVNRVFIWRVEHLPKWRPLLDRYRQEWSVGLQDVPMAHRRYRLEYLLRLAERIEDNVKLPDESKTVRLLRILDKARLEMEDKSVHQTTMIFNALVRSSDEDLLRRREELLKRIQRYPAPMRQRMTQAFQTTIDLPVPAGPPQEDTSHAMGHASQTASST